MFNGVNTLSAADVAAVTGNHGYNNDGFGMNGGWWWAWIMIMALWGRGGFGWDGNGAGAAAATQADIQRGFDNSNVMSSLRGIEQGLCSLGYDQLAQMNGINTNVSATGNNIISALNQQTIADIQSTNGLRSQLQDCCCENRAAIAQVRYDMSTDTCAITQAIKDAANANMQNCNNNYRSLEGKIDYLVLESKNQKIADLQLQLNRCDRDNALQGVATQVINAVRPPASPAWLVPNPYANYGYSYNNCYGNSYYGNNCGGCCDQNRCCG